MCKANLESIYQALLRSLDDYTMDRRGDIGAWVREAAITALQVCQILYLDVLIFPVILLIFKLLFCVSVDTNSI